jgi:hypothetical protein
MALTAFDTAPTSSSIHASPPGRIRIEASTGVNSDRAMSGTTVIPPILTIGSMSIPIVFTEKPNVRRNSAKAEAGSQSA